MSTGKPLPGQLLPEDWAKLAAVFGLLHGARGPAVRVPPRVRKPNPAGACKARRARQDKATAKRRARGKIAKASRRKNRG